MSDRADSARNDRRPGVRRTVAVLVTIAVALYGFIFVRALLLS